jgi:hypothetical protein
MQPLAALNGDNYPKPVWHCSVRAAPEDRLLSDAEWARVAENVMHRTGLAREGDDLGVGGGPARAELVQRAVLAGIPLLAAASAPSSLAVELAEETGLTLVGFLRGQSMNVLRRDAPAKHLAVIRCVRPGERASRRRLGAW